MEIKQIGKQSFYSSNATKLDHSRGLSSNNLIRVDGSDFFDVRVRTPIERVRKQAIGALNENDCVVLPLARY